MAFCLTYSRGMKPFLIDYLRSRKSEIVDDSLEGKVIFNGLTSDNRVIPFAERQFRVLTLQKHLKETNKRELFDRIFECFASFVHLDDWVDKKSFRISIKTSGKWRRKIDSDKLAESLSRALKKKHKLSVNLRSPDVEICVQVTESFLFIGIPQRSLLSTRPYHRLNGLRSTVCDAMVHLAELECGQVVADVTCGSGSILVEAAHSLLPQCLFCVGFDCDPKSLITAKDNLRHFVEIEGQHSIVDLVSANLSADSFRWDCVQRVVADLPFGSQHGNDCHIRTVLFPKVFQLLRKFFGCRKERKIAVLMVSEGHRDEFRRSLKERISNLVIEVHCLSLGYTDAAILKIACSL